MTGVHECDNILCSNSFYQSGLGYFMRGFNNGNTIFHLNITYDDILLIIPEISEIKPYPINVS